MKKIVLCAAIFLAQSAFAVSDLSDDRVEIAPGVYGITHTENFEIVCKMKNKGDKLPSKMFLDTDFSAKSPYRLATSFPGGGRFMGMVGAEAKIVSSAKGRCPGLCLQLTIASPEGEKASVLFNQDPITGQKTVVVTNLSKNEVMAKGTCTENEVY